MTDVDERMLPKEVLESGQSPMAMELVGLKREYNNVVEANPKRARQMAEEQIVRVEQMKQQVQETALALPGAKAAKRRMYEWLFNMFDDYVAELKKRARSEPSPVDITRVEEILERAKRQRAQSSALGSGAQSSGAQSSARGSAQSSGRLAIEDRPRSRSRARIEDRPRPRVEAIKDK
jgi:hypothetical protein